ncbi:MAG: radical SAM family heme chaperone HemW [Thermodesulfovibrionales bacterium]
MLIKKLTLRCRNKGLSAYPLSLSANFGQNKITGLYIHIPFCARKCPYCDFYSLEGKPSGLIDDYISALIKEIDLYHEKINQIKTVYIGGGTPSILNIAQLTVLLEGLYRHIRPSEIIEFTVEVNPKSITSEKLRLFKDYAITRISLGAQSFKERDLKILGRLHSVDDSLKAVEDIKKFSFSLSIDLIYGIPEQTLKDWQVNLSMIEDLKPDHVSVYELTVEEGTPLHQEILRGKLKKPPEGEIVKMYEKAHRYLEDRGYTHYEVSNFAKVDRLCLHNLNYWKRGEYIGIGAGAHSFINKKRIENYNDLKKYMDSINEGRFPYKKIIELSPEDEFVEFLMLGLRLKEGISLDRIPGEASLKEKVLRRSLPLIERGFLERKENSLRPTLKGFLLLNEVITELI